MRFPPGTWTPFAVDASARRYFLGVWEDRPSLLCAYGEDTDGLARFALVQALFEAHGIKVPLIYAVDREERCAIQEFVEGSSLSRARWSQDLVRRLLGVTCEVASITSSEWPAEPEMLQLDEARLRFELAFFRVHFIEGFLNHRAPEGIEEALGALAEAVSSCPAALAHRDFHSENLLLRANGDIVVLDFQDALLAPRAYDAVSLAVDPYRKQSPRLTSAFRDRWLALHPGCEAEFGQTALQRALKALGTFGYQVTQRKRARYMRFIPTQAAHALDFLSAAPADLSCLRPLLQSARVGAG